MSAALSVPASRTAADLHAVADGWFAPTRRPSSWSIRAVATGERVATAVLLPDGRVRMSTAAGGVSFHPGVVEACRTAAVLQG